eukprot:scaffold2135_cov341-Prasinococcus_capsulatus_cf.AAC.4
MDDDDGGDSAAELPRARADAPPRHTLAQHLKVRARGAARPCPRIVIPQRASVIGPARCRAGVARGAARLLGGQPGRDPTVPRGARRRSPAAAAAAAAASQRGGACDG